MAGDILGRQRGADLARFERGHLFVQGANADALLIVQNRTVYGAGDMIFGKFCRGAHVDDLVKLPQL